MMCIYIYIVNISFGRGSMIRVLTERESHYILKMPAKIIIIKLLLYYD